MSRVVPQRGLAAAVVGLATRLYNPIVSLARAMTSPSIFQGGSEILRIEPPQAQISRVESPGVVPPEVGMSRGELPPLELPPLVKRRLCHELASFGRDAGEFPFSFGPVADREVCDQCSTTACLEIMNYRR